MASDPGPQKIQVDGMDLAVSRLRLQPDDVVIATFRREPVADEFAPTLDALRSAFAGHQVVAVGPSIKFDVAQALNSGLISLEQLLMASRGTGGRA